MLCVLPIERIVVWSRTSERVHGFRDAVAHHGLQVDEASSVEEVFAESDVVCTLTPSVEPIVRGDWFRPGQHVNAVGARPRPGEREIDSAGMARARVVVDHRGTAEAKSGEYLLALADGAISSTDIVGELGQVINGDVIGRVSDDDVTLFNSVGIGLQDLAVGRLAYDRARELGLGYDVDMSN